MLEYHFPPISLLMSSEESSQYQSLEQSKRVAEKVDRMFENLGLASRVVDQTSNPYSTILRIKPNGVKESSLRNLRKDFEYATGSLVEFQERDAGFYVAVKRNYRPVISLREVMEGTAYRQSESTMTVAAGVDLFGGGFVIDLMKEPNLLVAGVTGAGKSVFLADVILSVLFRARPEEVKMILMDIKGVDLTAFNGIPHLDGEKVITDLENEVSAFGWLKNETVTRLAELRSTKVNDIDEYNKKYGKKYPHILVVVDEYMQLMQLPDARRKDMLSVIAEISYASPRTGIHLVLATQCPSAEVINKDIKNNIKARASFTVVDGRESQIIIDMTGAERLIGSGDMIYTSPQEKEEIHGRSAYVSDEEIDRVVAFMKDEKAQPVPTEKVETSLAPAEKVLDIDEEIDKLMDRDDDNGECWIANICIHNSHVDNAERYSAEEYLQMVGEFIDTAKEKYDWSDYLSQRQSIEDVFFDVMDEHGLPDDEKSEALEELLSDFFDAYIDSKIDIAENENYQGEIPAIDEENDINTVAMARVLAHIEYLPEDEDFLKSIDVIYDYDQLHMVCWFSNQITLGQGKYSRSVPNHSSRATYNRLSNPYSLLWICTVLGIDQDRLRKAAEEMKNEKSYTAQSGIVRKAVPFDEILPIVKRIWQEMLQSSDEQQ